MKVVRADLPQDIEMLELHIFADEHIGDAMCDKDRLKQRIDYIKETPNAYCVLNGDVLDTATRSSIGDIETRELNIMEQMQTGLYYFEPIKDKILCITNGNHEARVYNKEGVDISRLIAMQLGIADKYSPDAIVLFLRFGNGGVDTHGRRILYTGYLNHGRGGGRREGAKAIRLADMASIIDTDFYVHSHTHLPMIMKEDFLRIDTANSRVAPVTKLFVNNASNLNYGGYGVANEFKPASKDTPVIYLNGKIKEMNAKL